MTHQQNTHERLADRREVKSSSDKNFGFVFAIVFSIIGFWPLISSDQPRFWAMYIGAAFLGAAFLLPKALHPLNRLWMAFGLVLHKMVNPLVMGLLFFMVVTPIGLLMRLLGKRTLDLQIDESRQSYWIERDQPGPAIDGMKNQF